MRTFTIYARDHVRASALDSTWEEMFKRALWPAFSDAVEDGDMLILDLAGAGAGAERLAIDAGRKFARTYGMETVLDHMRVRSEDPEVAARFAIEVRRAKGR